MSYQALYRVWRPQRFADIVGQEMITRTLKNAIVTGQTSHAYLFAGPRGTGKTSAAKIFAKAINCPNQKDGEPCNECAICKAITAGTLNDVIEIDAASNNGVEEIRNIRDKAKYAPTEATYKIYIIDEVHMLSTGAFNALLKTLEEPPANVVFILATTEPYKIPATIISRTQRFDFKRITPQDSYQRMAYILKEKGIDFDQEALKMVAKASEGGMRDALSILDQVLSFSDNKLTMTNVLDVTGDLSQTQIDTLMGTIQANDTAQALTQLHQILADGKDEQRLLEDLIDYCRNLLVYQQAPQVIAETELTNVSDGFKKLSQTFPAARLYRMIDILDDVQQQLRFTNHPDIYLEVLMIKLSAAQNSTESKVHLDSTTAAEPAAAAPDAMVSKLEDQVKALSQQVQQLSKGTSSKPKRQNRATTSTPHKVKVNKAAIYPILDSATRQALNRFKEVWPDLMNMLSITKRAVMNVSRPVAANEHGVIVAFDYQLFFERVMNDQDLLDELKAGLNKLLGDPPEIVLVPHEDWPVIRKEYLQTDRLKSANGQSGAPAAENEAEKVPKGTKKALELFGKDIVEVHED
ncbi:DNA polymerase III subunit gamma/tau [Lactobacillus sp. CC-MHH1034]|uniref:DNA polymerase III subunit gamma/tau n=1 Tax=Agrilactobacillus fermenti TaxID=2586909 RepID=UPI001E55C1D5|nr:DNA polymerase III subunit gamma/tau [Agrilactobacillus fermenti]MCD2255441.1 DNA polymerase III subunit gamma/tau [Agrilactobacillus fermenti]